MVAAHTITLIIAAVATFGQAKLDCDGVRFDLRNGFCYLKVGDVGAATFNSAEQFCDTHQASLVSIHDSQENEFVAQYHDEQYIGLHNVSGLVQWTDGSLVDYTNYDDDTLSVPFACVKMVKGIWHAFDCAEPLPGHVCKKKAVELPDTPVNQCPSYDNIYSNYGAIYSPGYPDYFEGDLTCTYRVKAQAGYNVALEIREIFLFSNGFVEFYEGWSANKDNLLYNTSFDNVDEVKTKDSNMMLIVFRGTGTGYWRFGFYSLPKPTPAYSANCPTQNIFGEDSVITSPSFPFTYDVNSNCIYFVDFDCHPTFLWELDVLELQLGSDDYIDFINLRTNTIFASTGTGISEGTQLSADFPVAIHFVSGDVADLFTHWRIFVTARPGHV